jgi:hypothetical protein
MNADGNETMTTNKGNETMPIKRSPTKTTIKWSELYDVLLKKGYHEDDIDEMDPETMRRAATTTRTHETQGNETMTKYRFEIREYDADSNSYGEAYEHSEGESIADFEDYVDQFAVEETEDAASKPFGAIAGRDFEANGQHVSAFCYRNQPQGTKQ